MYAVLHMESNIEHFHLCDQRLYFLFKQKKVFANTKNFNSHRISLLHSRHLGLSRNMLQERVA